MKMAAGTVWWRWRGRVLTLCCVMMAAGDMLRGVGGGEGLAPRVLQGAGCWENLAPPPSLASGGGHGRRVVPCHCIRKWCSASKMR